MSSGPLPVKNLDEILRDTLGPALKVESTSWSYLTEPGENYGSLIIAVNIDTATNVKGKKSYNLVVKLPPPSNYLQKLFNSPVTFQKELAFYRDAVPAFVEAQLECGFNEQDLISLAPKFYGGRMCLDNDNNNGFDNQAAIVLENLVTSNYTTQNRIAGLDRTHMEFAVRELAKLHAIPIYLKLKKPKVFERSIAPACVEVADENALQSLWDMVNKALDTYKTSDKAKPYFDRILATVEHGLNQLKDENAKQPREPWTTLIHNDFWVNNMMFRYDSAGNVTDMKMVDFQLCARDYGINDLIFFIVSSSQRDVLEAQFDSLVQLYYETFISCLESFGVDTKLFPKSEFHELLEECGPNKFFQCIMMVPVINATRGSATKMEDIEDSSAFLDHGSPEVYVDRLLQILYVYEKKGWLCR